MQSTLQLAFEQYYGLIPSYITRAPGRVNLIGEHTDYNDGYVLPMAIDRHIWIVAHPRNDSAINVYSMDFDKVASFSTSNLKRANLPAWTSHVRGVWYLLREQDIFVPGADILIHGDVPMGAGLSSSAALEVALIEMALALANNNSYTQKAKALLGVEVEHQFIGMPCGVMDQMASAVSEAGHALLIDCQDLATTPVHLPNNVEVVVMDTKVSHELVDADYGKRRQECEQASEIMGIKSLRLASLDMIYQHKNDLGDVRLRRAKHVITENQRVIAMIKALRKDNLDRAGELMNESHHSLQHDFEVSCPELDMISAIARKQPGCYGARMMGGGFGGSAVALVQPDAVANFTQNVAADYTKQTNLIPDIFTFKPGSGSEIMMTPDQKNGA